AAVRPPERHPDRWDEPPGGRGRALAGGKGPGAHGPPPAVIVLRRQPLPGARAGPAPGRRGGGTGRGLGRRVPAGGGGGAGCPGPALRGAPPACAAGFSPLAPDSAAGGRGGRGRREEGIPRVPGGTLEGVAGLGGRVAAIARGPRGRPGIKPPSLRRRGTGKVEITDEAGRFPPLASGLGHVR